MSAYGFNYYMPYYSWNSASTSWPGAHVYRGSVTVERGVRLNPRHFSGKSFWRAKPMSKDRIEGFAGLTELDKARLRKAEEKRKRKAAKLKKILKVVREESDEGDDMDSGSR